MCLRFFGLFQKKRHYLKPFVYGKAEPMILREKGGQLSDLAKMFRSSFIW